MEQQYLQELKSLPLGFKLIHAVHGFPLYSSNRLKDNFTAATARCKNLRPVLQEIKSFVDIGLIIPVVSYSGLIRFIIQNTFDKTGGLDAHGLYDTQTKKIYIIADLKFRDFFKTDSEELGIVILHELMHYCSSNKPKIFNAIFRNINAEYYHNMFKNWVQLDIPMADCVKMNDYLFINMEHGKNTNLLQYTKFLATIIPESKSHPSHIREEIIETIISMVKYIRSGDTASLARDMRIDPMINNLIVAMMTTYEKTFKLRKPDTFPMQELFIPSEIAAVLCHKPTTNHYTAIKKIA